MWKFSATISLIINLLLATVQAEQNKFLRDYSITPSNHMVTYHYPAPPKSQQLYDPASLNTAVLDYQNQYRQANYQHAPPTSFTWQPSASITKQFVSPALENAAFNLALNHQGYRYGKPRAAFNAALTNSPARAGKSSSQTPPVLGSLNVKLPLPFGSSPLNIAPLPLQAGAPYSAIINAVTSYGTVYPQRRRR